MCWLYDGCTRQASFLAVAFILVLAKKFPPYVCDFRDSGGIVKLRLCFKQVFVGGGGRLGQKNDNIRLLFKPILFLRYATCCTTLSGFQAL